MLTDFDDIFKKCHKDHIVKCLVVGQIRVWIQEHFEGFSSQIGSPWALAEVYFLQVLFWLSIILHFCSKLDSLVYEYMNQLNCSNQTIFFFCRSNFFLCWGKESMLLVCLGDDLSLNYCSRMAGSMPNQRYTTIIPRT